MNEPGPEITVVTSIDGAEGMLETAALIACSKSSDDGLGLLVCFSDGKLPEPTVFSTGAAKDVEAGLRVAGFEASARGAICVAAIDEDEVWLDRLISLVEAGEGVRPVVAIPPHHYSELVNCDSFAVESIVFRADRPGDVTPPLLGLATDEAREVCETVTVADERPGWLKGRRALAGAISGTRVLEVPESRSGKPSRLRGLLARDRGQATPMVLGAVFVLVLGTVLLVAVGGAVTGKARAQRAVDLSALSAARSMKTDLPRLLAPPTLPNGMPNPAHMPKPVYLLRARLSAVRIATANGAAPWAVAVRFPDAVSYAPVRVRVAVRARVRGGRPSLTESWAEARVSVPPRAPDMAICSRIVSMRLVSISMLRAIAFRAAASDGQSGFWRRYISTVLSRPIARFFSKMVSRSASDTRTCGSPKSTANATTTNASAGASTRNTAAIR